jgi:hypothetical protein
MAGMLSIFSGPNFWEFNVMELFAFIAIIVGAVLAYRKFRSEQRRKDKLIFFPNNWSASRNLPQAVLEVTAIVDVLIPHHAFGYNGFGYILGKQVPFQFTEPNQHLSKVGRWIMNGTIPLPSIPPDMNNVELRVEIILDGEIKKKSEKRVLSIPNVGVAPSTPDKEGSQTE